MTQVYLASGWFNDSQKQMMEEIYTVLTRMQREFGLEIFAPFYNGIVLKPTDPPKLWEAVFTLDVDKIKTSHLMIANIEGFEPGTIFECGVAWGYKVPVIGYSSVKGRGLNLMLAQSCIGFANSQTELNSHILTFLKNPAIKRINRWMGEPI